MSEYLYRVDKNIIIGKEHVSKLVDILKSYLMYLMYPNLKKNLTYLENLQYPIWSF